MKKSQIIENIVNKLKYNTFEKYKIKSLMKQLKM